MSADALDLLLVGGALATRAKVRACVASDGGIAASVRTVASVAQALPLLDERAFDAVLFALAPGAAQLDAIGALELGAPDVPVLAIAESDDLLTARMAMRGGAEDCLNVQELTPAGLLRAVTLAGERKRKLAELTRMAWRDALTGLPNRALLEDRLANMVARARRYGGLIGLLFIDLDDFKLVNDSIGHAGGDALLRGVAKRLSGAIRRGDTAARLGGDEFVVALESLSRPEDAAEVAETIQSLLAEPFHLDGVPVLVSASIGIAHLGPEAADVDALMRVADKAMYRAKWEKSVRV